MITISAIVTCYNEGELIYNALDSLYKQTDKDFEIILINDCSPYEETNEVCRKISATKKAIVLRNETNLGLSGARNEAIDKMQGNVAVLLDADDVLPDNAISNIRKSFESDPIVDFVFGNYIKSENGIQQIVDCSVITGEEGFISPVLLANNWILLGTSPFRKRLWERIGGYSHEFSNTCQDVDFWQRAILNNASGVYIHQILYIWNRNISGMNATVANKEAFDACNIKNIEFYFKFSTDSDKPFRILYSRKKINEIKARSAALPGFSLLKLAQWIPDSMIPYYFKLYFWLFKEL